jgi:enterochelin esterase-like enzyme
MKTSKCYFIFVFFFLLSSSGLFSQTYERTVKGSIASNTLGRTMKYTVYLPPSYFKDTTIDFPVIYLLHGYGGNEEDWIKYGYADKIMDSLVAQNTISESILVMPSANNSYFINNYDNSFRYEDFFIDEFIPYIESHFRIQPSFKSRSICGLSMGGAGSVILAVKHPALFSTCIAFSSAVRPAEVFSRLSPERYNHFFLTIFGPLGSGNDRITDHWKSNSPYFIIDSVYAQKLKTVNWYIDCGMQDYLYPSNQALHQLLYDYNIPHEYHMRIGGHNWKYWKKGLLQSLIYLEDQRNKP